MPIPDIFAPNPAAVQDRWTDASYRDVVLAQMVAALIASGKYAPGTLLMQLAIAATTQLMVETARVSGLDRSGPLDEALFKEAFRRL